MQLPSTIGAENKPKLIAAVVLMLIAVVVIGQSFFSGSSAPSSASPAASDPTSGLTQTHTSARAAARTKKNARPRSLDPTLRYDWLKQSESTEYKGSGRNIFLAQAEIPQPQSNGSTDHNTAAAVAPPVDNTPPPPPPINLKFFGFASRPGEPKKVFLSQGEDVFIASEGEIIDRRYKILRISAMSVEVEDVLNNNRQEIPLSPS